MAMVIALSNIDGCHIDSLKHSRLFQLQFSTGKYGFDIETGPTAYLA